jgi:hypothetical protein
MELYDVLAGALLVAAALTALADLSFQRQIPQEELIPIPVEKHRR